MTSKVAVLPASPSGSWSSGKLTSTVRSSPAAAPRELGVELGQQALAAELDDEVARLRALERLAVDRAAEVDHDRVAGRRRPVDRGEAGEALAQPVELGRDRLVGDLDLGLADLDPLPVAELGLRTHADLDREVEVLALGRKLADVELRLADRGDAGIEQGALVPLGQRLAERLFDHRLAADPLDHELGRHLALAEARQLHLAGQAPGGPVDPLRKVVRGDRDIDFHPRLGQLRD